MKSIKFLVIFILIVLSGCNLQTEKSIDLFNGMKYKVTDNERTLKLNRPIVDHFQSYFATGKFQNPLYRYIKGPDYETFIALPVMTTFEEMISYNIVNPDSIVVNKCQNDSSIMYRTYKNKKSNLVEFVMSIDGSMVYILTEIHSDNFYPEIFGYEAIKNRIKSL